MIGLSLAGRRMGECLTPGGKTYTGARTGRGGLGLVAPTLCDPASSVTNGAPP